MRVRTLALVAALVPGLALAADSDGKWSQKAGSGKTLYATLHTSVGDIVAKLFSKEAPKTVQNFVGLATGEKEWTDPRSGEHVKKPLYSGTVFHRVIPLFMIQGGDPLGQGTGGPGYKFEDEFNSDKTFGKAGMLAMANSGPNTNGSQFFITVHETNYLNHKHTIFGEVVSGYEIAEKISQVPRGRMDRPNEAVTINSIDISEKPPKAAAKQ